MSVADAIGFVLTLLLGGSGWAAIHALLVRPRVFMDYRDQWTVTLADEIHRAEIERAMESLSVPTALFEVAWWNRGLRSAKQVRVEVTSPFPIQTWKMVPAAEDLAGGWVVTHDPSRKDSDHHRLRLEQQALMPRAECHLTVGYSPPGEDERSPSVRAFQDDREISGSALNPKLQWVAVAAGVGFESLRAHYRT